MALHILVIEDEMDLAELVAFNLREAGYQVTTALSGASGLAHVRSHTPDLILLDLMLPDISGVEVCRRLRRAPETAHTPVLMLTAKDSEVDRVVGFEVGADDYVVKPFSLRVLMLRIDAILRRTKASTHAQKPNIISIGPLTLDVTRHQVTVEDQEVPLTALEFRLLYDLATRIGRVQSRDALLERVWEYAAGTETRTVDTHIKRLREKLGSAASMVETVRGVGYRIRERAGTSS